MLVLDSQILRKNVVRSADDEFVDNARKLDQTFVTFFPFVFCSCCITSFEDWQFKLLAELVLRPQQIGIGEV